jgi:3-methyladenine DNA glycosylase AlkD
MEQSFNELQTVKRRLFAMRNGVIADALRKGGSPFRIIFGVNLPQLIEIAQDTPHNAELARRLWANKTTRESLLLAPMIFPKEEMSQDEAFTWASEVDNIEVADILCHRLLRHLDFADSLAEELGGNDDTKAITRYVGLRLTANRMHLIPEKAKLYAERELNRHDQLTEHVAKMIIEEVDFILG